MTTLEMWVQGSLAKALGWTLVHSLWEGAAVAFLLAIVLGIARSSKVRYAASCFAMVALLVAFGATFYRLLPREGAAAKAALAPLAVTLPADDGSIADLRTAWRASDLLPWLGPLWVVGVVLFQLRCLASWIAAGRLRRIGTCGAPDVWIGRLGELRERLRITKPVTLLESCLAEVPVVIGHLRPVILMPVGLLAGLPGGQVEAILLHELAHIRRADYLINLMQTLVEGLLFYHPAAWWVSSAIRTERENCCDDLVVSTNISAHEYATALAALAESRWAAREPAMAATGGSLVKRIRRLLSSPESPRLAVTPVLSLGILVLTGAVALTAWEAPQQNAPAIAQATLTAPASPGPVEHRRPSAVVAQNGPGVSRPAQADPATSPYQKWLKEDVVYIITDQERADFKKLRTDAERDQFIKAFWDGRNPVPGLAKNEYREEHYRRIAYANARFGTKIPGWKTDRGRIYIQYGPPDEIDSHPNGGKYDRPAEEGGGATETYPFEQWRYRWIENVGENVIIEFVDKDRTGDYRMTMDPSAKDATRVVEPTMIFFAPGGPGGGPRAAVKIGTDRKMTVTIPIAFEAHQYLITATTTSEDGQTNLGSSQILVNSCTAAPGQTGCLQDRFSTMGAVALPPGNYAFTGVVKDTGGSTQKTYVVHFTVN